MELEDALERQGELMRFVADRQLVVMTLMLEREAEDWPPIVQRRAKTRHTGVAWLSEEGLMTSRLTPLSEL